MYYVKVVICILFHYSIWVFVCECILLYWFQKSYGYRWYSQSWVLWVKTKKIYISITINFNKILKSMKTKLFQLPALHATIYFIWRERNERKHNSSNKSVDQVARLIDKAARNHISSTNYVLNPKLHGLMIRWFDAHASVV